MVHLCVQSRSGTITLSKIDGAFAPFAAGAREDIEREGRTLVSSHPPTLASLGSCAKEARKKAATALARRPDPRVSHSARPMCEEATSFDKDPSTPADNNQRRKRRQQTQTSKQARAVD